MSITIGSKLFPPASDVAPTKVGDDAKGKLEKETSASLRAAAREVEAKTANSRGEGGNVPPIVVAEDGTGTNVNLGNKTSMNLRGRTGNDKDSNFGPPVGGNVLPIAVAEAKIDINATKLLAKLIKQEVSTNMSLNLRGQVGVGKDGSDFAVVGSVVYRF